MPINKKTKVYLVGAGPGDPGLFTLKGLVCLSEADVIIYDRLANPKLLEAAREDAEKIYVGKTAGKHTLKQDEINSLLIERAKEGKTVCRLKGGDPYVYGRGGEEAEALSAEGIPFEEVPGITSAIAAPAYAGIPVTHRKMCSALGIITGHEDPAKTESSIRWDKISTGLDTLVFLMGVENLPNIVSNLVANGRSPETPIALVRWGTFPYQETLTGTLQDIVQKVKESGFTAPAVTIVGDVVSLREKMRWFDNRPLFGKRILVTRAREQASKLSCLLEENGAEAVEFPVIKMEAISDTAAAEKLLSHPYDWVLFTSVHGVEYLLKQLQALNQDIRALGSAKLGAIGPATADSLEKLGLRVDFVPTQFVAEKMISEFPLDPKGLSILIPRAETARNTLPELLTERGAQVDVIPVYRTVPQNEGADQIRDQLKQELLDVITFTSSSTVTNFIQQIGKDADFSQVHFASIGPITTQTAKKLGLQVDIEAEEYSIPGLVESILSYFEKQKT